MHPYLNTQVASDLNGWPFDRLRDHIRQVIPKFIVGLRESQGLSVAKPRSIIYIEAQVADPDFRLRTPDFELKSINTQPIKNKIPLYFLFAIKKKNLSLQA